MLGGYWELLARYLRAQLGAVAVLAALVVGNVGLQLLNPQILRYFVDTTIASGPLQTLTIAAGIYFGVAAAQQLVSIGVAYTGDRVAWRATNALRADLALHCLRLDPEFHQQHPPGEMIERIDGDVNALANFFSQFVLLLVANGLFLVGMLVLIAFEHWVIGLVLAAFTTATFALLSRMQARIVPHLKAISQAAAALFGFLEERLAGIEDLQSRGAGPYVLRLYHRLARTRFERFVHYQTSAPNLVLSFAQAAFVFGNVLALALAATFFAAGELTLGTVFMIYQYANTLGQPIRALVSQLQDFQAATASVQRLVELTRLRSAVWDGGGPSVFSPASGGGRTPLSAGPLGVQLDGVIFAYPGGEAVLHGLSVAIEPGRRLGLLGRTGSGKTTIGRLLVRLHDPTEGVVKLDGVDLRVADLRDVRRRVGVVTQEVQLLNATVRDNLTLFDDSISDARLRAVIERLALDKWFAQLPRGLDTRLAPGGSDLSAGEAQLLAFARVFLRDPGLVILDEASSRLDPLTETRVERAVGELLKGRTAVVIAHRLATVRQVDDVLIIDGGRAVELGDRAMLAANANSRLSALLRTGMEPAVV
jgi:ATP-binding cassette subfamily B protein